MASELWKPVVGWKGYYEVSSLGRVRSVTRTVMRRDGRPYPIKGRVMKAHLDRHLGLTLTKPGKSTFANVHVLVAKAFIPNPSKRPMVCHKNDDPSNNRVTNLYWGDAADNSADATKNGKIEVKRGQDHKLSILTNRSGQLIRRMKKQGYTYKEIGTQVGVSPQRACDVVKNRAYV